jgi:hypothetical protein
MWFQVELPEPARLTEIQFDSPMQRIRPDPPANGNGAVDAQPTFVPTAPAAYRIELSLDGQDWVAVAEGAGGSTRTVASFPAREARFIRITQTGEAPEGDPSWAMMGMRLYERRGD